MKRTNVWIAIAIIGLILGLNNCAANNKPKTQTRDAANIGGIPSPSVEQEAGAENLQAPNTVQEQAEETSQTGNGENPEELLEQAMADFEEAQAAWEKGDNDAALESLDEAYSLIARLKAPPDSTLFQEKNDLRLMIAQKIREIYAVHPGNIENNRNSIPLVENQYVEREIKSFQTREREYFLESYKRSGMYRGMILQELKNAGLPEELSWIPVIESGFKVRAYSRARALGLWQFIASTAYRFGLKQDRWVDERMDPLKSTRAAIKYLGALHELFGDWTTALASYNCGEFQVQRVIRAQRIDYLDNFWDLFIMLPGETARFVPRIIAVLLIIQNPAKYGFALPEPDPPMQYEIVFIDKPVKLSDLSRTIGLGEEDLALLNPELRFNATPEREYHIKVPVGYGKQTLEAFQNLPKWIPAEASYIIHRVHRGETVSQIARRYRTSVAAIARLNNLRRNYMIRPGQRLKIPSRGARL